MQLRETSWIGSSGNVRGERFRVFPRGVRTPPVGGGLLPVFSFNVRSADAAPAPEQPVLYPARSLSQRLRGSQVRAALFFYVVQCITTLDLLLASAEASRRGNPRAFSKGRISRQTSHGFLSPR